MLSPLLNVYSRTDITFKKGKGSCLFDEKGKKYIDLGAGIAVNSLGYAHPKLVKVMQEAATKPWHVSNIFQIPDQTELGAKLIDNSSVDYAFFCNSGAESLETAFKIVRKYFNDNNQPGRKEVLTFEHAFHGRTFTAISAAGSKKYQQGYEPLVSGFKVIAEKDWDIDVIEKKYITKKTAAIAIEPIQGEGGVNVFDGKFLKALEKLCKKHDIVLILDEVQCGLGRTGKLFHHQWFDIKPDIICSAKGIGGGFPLGACLVNKKLGAVMTPGSHGGTYGGNPLAMAIGNAVVGKILKEEFLEKVVEKGKFLKAKLADLQKRYPEIIEEVKGEGLLLGLKIKGDHIALVDEFRKQKVITIPASNNVIRIIPPLVITKREMIDAVKQMEQGLYNLKK